MSDSQTRIKQMVDGNDVLLFMKGTRYFPRCGFSQRSANILTHLGVKFETFDVLEDMEIRQGVKEFANWPTIPQLYVGHAFLGGSDIMTEMYRSGELAELVKDLPKDEAAQP
jgi:monothiol glutaredoxin